MMVDELGDMYSVCVFRQSGGITERRSHWFPSFTSAKIQLTPIKDSNTPNSI